MGRAKALMMEAEERGWSSGNESVCLACVTDEVLAAAIAAESASDLTCDFCGQSPAAPIDALLGPFVVGVRRLYEHAGDTLIWDGQEGGYQGGPTADTPEVVEDFADVFVANALRERVADLIEDETWVRKNWAWPDAGEALTDGWERFSHEVKFVTRFVMWRRPVSPDDWSGGEIGPAAVLDAIGRLVDLYPVNLVCELGSDVPLWRARPHDLPLPFVPNAKELGTTPIMLSRKNRMSPAGIPLFYAAFDEETAVTESAREAKKSHVTSSTFTLTGTAKLLDLTNLQPIPSLFADNGDEIPQWKFLHHFAEQVSKPPDVAEIDYVPTQVMTEFFLRVFGDGSFFDGIQYASSLVMGGVNVALDISNDHCLEADEFSPDPDDAMLRAVLDGPSVTTQPVN